MVTPSPTPIVTSVVFNAQGNFNDVNRSISQTEKELANANRNLQRMNTRLRTLQGKGVLSQREQTELANLPGRIDAAEKQVAELNREMGRLERRRNTFAFLRRGALLAAGGIAAIATQVGVAVNAVSSLRSQAIGLGRDVTELARERLVIDPVLNEGAAAQVAGFIRQQQEALASGATVDLPPGLIPLIRQGVAESELLIAAVRQFGPQLAAGGPHAADLRRQLGGLAGQVESLSRDTEAYNELLDRAANRDAFGRDAVSAVEAEKRYRALKTEFLDLSTTVTSEFLPAIRGIFAVVTPVAGLIGTLLTDVPFLAEAIGVLLVVALTAATTRMIAMNTQMAIGAVRGPALVAGLARLAPIGPLIGGIGAGLRGVIVGLRGASVAVRGLIIASGPIGLIVTAVGLLVAGITLAVTRLDLVKRVATGVANTAIGGLNALIRGYNAIPLLPDLPLIPRIGGGGGEAGSGDRGTPPPPPPPPPPGTGPSAPIPAEAAQVVPLARVAPVTERAPVAPVAAVAPTAPVAAVAPIAPTAAVAPTAPIAPVAETARVAAVAPVAETAAAPPARPRDADRPPLEVETPMVIPAPVTPAVAGQPSHVTMYNTFSITQLPGESSEDFARRVAEVIADQELSSVAA